MDNKLSNCHNAPVKDVDGKEVCEVCGQPCESHSEVQGDAPKHPDVAAAKPGDKCVLPEGGEGIIAPDGACVPVATQEQMPKVGDACEIEGKPGVFEQGENGLVCKVTEPAQ